ncbi:progranulin-like [Galendromus occidentalis]|uniref:Progranulin-like n=1 Tax=Galendromus occidentalis TaxID=34638 RepID=A0AAJ7SHP4_9ACAR|nr:progranulin-like [Galendromus occidentalis]
MHSLSLVVLVCACSLATATTCPDNSHCDDSQTCCPTGNDHYGCCPYVDATCCADKLHCCPPMFVCHVSSSTCRLGKISLPWAARDKGVHPKSENRHSSRKGAVQCPDSSHCKSGETCCRIPGGKHKCCPFPNATCCPDNGHCCPMGHSCDLHTMTCYLAEAAAAGTVKLRKT